MDSTIVDLGPRRPGPENARSVHFCSSCGQVHERAPRSRVCPDCGLGVLLSCAGEALPARTASFLVVARDLTVSAVSSAAERLLGDDAAGQPLSALLAGRDGNGELTRQVARAASGLSGTASVPVNVEGRRGAYEALVSPCGPPRAALVVLQRPAG